MTKSYLSIIGIFLSISLFAQDNVTKSYEYFNEGIIFYKEKYFDAAIRYYTKAIDLNEEYPKAYYYRANCKLKLKEYDSAVKDFKLAIKYDEQFAKAHLYKGHAQMQLKEYDKSLASFEDALDLDPKLAKAHLNK